jgi:amino acid transporter
MPPRHDATTADNIFTTFTPSLFFQPFSDILSAAAMIIFFTFIGFRHADTLSFHAARRH